MSSPDGKQANRGPGDGWVRWAAAGGGFGLLVAVIIYTATQERSAPAPLTPADRPASSAVDLLFAQSRQNCMAAAAEDASLPPQVVAQMQSFCACESAVIQDAFESEEALAEAINRAGITVENAAGFEPLIATAFDSPEQYFQRLQACADAQGEPEE